MFSSVVLGQQGKAPSEEVPDSPACVADSQGGDHDASGNEPEPDDIDVSEYPRFGYSNRDVKRAGELIASRLPWTRETDARIREAFAIANNWRDAHAYPMKSIRYSVIQHMRHSGASGITAARLKRMHAIRAKLERVGLSLNQLQDLGGCRAILDTMEDVQKLVSAMQASERHEQHKHDDYIQKPKPDGYRGHHIILKFKDQRDPASTYNGRRIEVQVRTRLQHSWATAVEAVGLFRGEGLKNHLGSQDWLRLFMLMSGELAETEDCAPPEGCSDAQARRIEIRKLAKSLDAVATLNMINNGVRGTDQPLAPGYHPSHYLIRYDNESKTVTVQPMSGSLRAVESYGDAESPDNLSGGDSKNVVLVEVDKVENLKAAYPNYFGDVSMFSGFLNTVANGSSAMEYSRRIQTPPRPRIEAVGDISWIGRSRFPRPDAVKKRPK